MSSPMDRLPVDPLGGRGSQTDNYVNNFSNSNSCESDLTNTNDNQQRHSVYVKYSSVCFENDMVVQERARKAGASQDLLTQYQMYHRYSALLEKSSIKIMGYALTPKMSRIVIDRTIKSKKRTTPLSSEVSYPVSSSSRRNEFIWNELVKLNGREQSSNAESDPVTFELTRKEAEAQNAEDHPKQNIMPRATNNILHFYRSSHKIKELDTYLKYKRSIKDVVFSKKPKIGQKNGAKKSVETCTVKSAASSTS